MGFRRKRDAVAIEHKWKQFVSQQAALFQRVGLPAWVSDNHEYWQDVIHYGYPEQYQGGTPASVPGFNLLEAEPTPLALFVTLLERYFESGFAYREPAFLKARDRRAYDRLRERFAP